MNPREVKSFSKVTQLTHWTESHVLRRISSKSGFKFRVLNPFGATVALLGHSPILHPLSSTGEPHTCSLEPSPPASGILLHKALTCCYRGRDVPNPQSPVCLQRQDRKQLLEQGTRQQASHLPVLLRPAVAASAMTPHGHTIEGALATFLR